MTLGLRTHQGPPPVHRSSSTVAVKSGNAPNRGFLLRISQILSLKHKTKHIIIKNDANQWIKFEPIKMSFEISGYTRMLARNMNQDKEWTRTKFKIEGKRPELVVMMFTERKERRESTKRPRETQGRKGKRVGVLGLKEQGQKRIS